MELKWKIISFLGDSNTFGKRISDKEKDRFDNIIKQMCGLKRVNNYGISGTRIAYQKNPSPKALHDEDFCMRAWQLDPESDVIVVMGGSNDYYTGDAPLGEIGDKTRSTFSGALEYLCSLLEELYPKAVKVFLTPSHCKEDYLPSPSPLKANCPEKRTLVEYVDRVIEIAKAHGFPVFDMYRNLGIDLSKPDQAKQYSYDSYHFNEVANHIIAEKLAGFLQELPDPK